MAFKMVAGIEISSTAVISNIDLMTYAAPEVVLETHQEKLLREVWEKIQTMTYEEFRNTVSVTMFEEY